MRKNLFPFEQSVIGEYYLDAPIITNFPYKNRDKIIDKANKILDGQFIFFHYHTFNLGFPPNWFQSPFNGESAETNRVHWTELSDFSLRVGDIKTIWELSRFDWLTDLARAYRISGETKYLKQINNLLNDWSKHNPLNYGINWKCGQEASFRIMKLITTAQVLNQFESPSETLCTLVFHHLKRINPNINYAIAQDNNHATSEAAALYIGSVWLLKYGYYEFNHKKCLNKWKHRGRKILEERIVKLIANDGTFSQKSINYHRVLIDTLSWVLIIMRQLDEKVFSKNVENKIKAAGNWLYQFVNITTGYVPNIGANDGAMIENLHSADYRDFRPSVQQFFVAAFGHYVYPVGVYDEPLFWRLGVKIENLRCCQLEKSNAIILDNEFLILRNKSIEVFLKIPNDNFRPSNNPFHIEIWHSNRNIVIGPGSFSYNAGEVTNKYKSIISHNTVQFNGLEPMPTISRFLSGAWIKPDNIGSIIEKDNVLSWIGSYRDYYKNWHQRRIRITENTVLISDSISNTQNAKVIWHVNDFNYSEFENTYKFEEFELQFVKSMHVSIFEDNNSLYYLNQSPHLRFDVYFLDQTINTTFHFH